MQQAERSEGRLGFGGSAPCAQTHGSQKFITKHPLDYQIDTISAGVTHKKPGLYGANKHERMQQVAKYISDIPNRIVTDLIQTQMLNHSSDETIKCQLTVFRLTIIFQMGNKQLASVHKDH